MGGLLHLVQRGGAWAGCGPAQSPPRCTKCNSPPINGQTVLIQLVVQRRPTPTHIDGVVVDVLEYAGVVVDLSLEESWWRRCRTHGRVGRLQVEAGRRTHCR